MSKFRVGQRVRFVGSWEPGDVSPAGSEGVISQGPGEFQGDTNGNSYTWLVECSGFDFLIAANSDELEPATDCYDKTEWSECIWRPEHLRVGA